MPTALDRVRELVHRARRGGFRPVEVAVSEDVREALREEFKTAPRAYTGVSPGRRESVFGLPLVVDTTRPANYIGVEIR